MKSHEGAKSRPLKGRGYWRPHPRAGLMAGILSALSIGRQMEAKIARCTIAAGRYLTEGGARQG
jgi:hypothetical protein